VYNNISTSARHCLRHTVNDALDLFSSVLSTSSYWSINFAAVVRGFSMQMNLRSVVKINSTNSLLCNSQQDCTDIHLHLDEWSVPISCISFAIWIWHCEKYPLLEVLTFITTLWCSSLYLSSTDEEGNTSF
jgi:hypothetical protein